MICLQLLIIHCLAGEHIDIVYLVDFLFHEHVNEFQKDLRRCFGIIDRTMVSLQRNTQLLTDDVQLMLFQLRQQGSGKLQCIQNGIFYLNTTFSLCIQADKACIEIGIMRHKHRILAKFQKLRQNFCNNRRIGYHFIRNACQLGNLRRNRAFWVHEGAETVDNLAVYYLYCANFRNTFGFLGKSCCLNIEYHKGVIQRLSARHGDNAAQIVNQIGFYAVNHLQVGFADCVHRIRKCLHNTMVSNGNCLMPPCNRAFDIFFHRCHTIHTAHLCMQMQLHALFLRIIHTGSRRGGSHDIFRHNIDFLGIFIKLHFALHAQIFTLFDFIAQFGIKNTFLHEKFHCSRIAQIRNIKGNNIFFTTNFSRLDVINTALDNDIFPENFRINNLLVCAVDFFAKQNPLGNGGGYRRHLCIGFLLHRRSLCGDNLSA